MFFLFLGHHENRSDPRVEFCHFPDVQNGTFFFVDRGANTINALAQGKVMLPTAQKLYFLGRNRVLMANNGKQTKNFDFLRTTVEKAT